MVHPVIGKHPGVSGETPMSSHFNDVRLLVSTTELYETGPENLGPRRTRRPAWAP